MIPDGKFSLPEIKRIEPALRVQTLATLLEHILARLTPSHTQPRDFELRKEIAKFKDWINIDLSKVDFALRVRNWLIHGHPINSRKQKADDEDIHRAATILILTVKDIVRHLRILIRSVIGINSNKLDSGFPPDATTTAPTKSEFLSVGQFENRLKELEFNLNQQIATADKEKEKLFWNWQGTCFENGELQKKNEDLEGKLDALTYAYEDLLDELESWDVEKLNVPGNIRVCDLARELNLESRQLVDICREQLALNVISWSVLTESQCNHVRLWMSQDSVLVDVEFSKQKPPVRRVVG